MGRGLRWGLAGRGFGRVTAMVAHFLLARWLPKADYGRFGVGWAVWRLSNFVAAVGLDKAVLRFGRGSRGIDSAGASASIWLALLCATLAGGALWLVTLAWPRLGFGKAELVPLLAAFAPATVVGALLRVVSSAATLDERADRAMIAEEICQPLSFTAGIVALRVAGVAGARPAVLVLSASLLTSLLVVAALLRRDRPFALLAPQRSGPYGPLFRFALLTLVASIFAFSIAWNDRLLAGYHLSAEEAGVYQGVAQLALSFLVVSSGINVVLAPTVARIAAADAPAGELDAAYSAATRWALALVLPAFVAICFEAESILTVIVGPGFAVGAPAFVALSAGHAVALACGSAPYLLLLYGRAKTWLVIYAVAAALQYVLWVWLPATSLGIATVTAVALAGGALASLLASRRLGVRLFDRAYGRVLVAGALPVPALYALRFVPIMQPFVRAAMATMVAFALTFGALWLLQRRTTT